MKREKSQFSKTHSKFAVKTMNNTNIKINKNRNKKKQTQIKDLKEYSDEMFLNSTSEPKVNQTNKAQNNKLILDVNKFHNLLNHRDHLELNSSPSVLTSLKINNKSEPVNLEDFKLEIMNISNNISSYLNYNLGESHSSASSGDDNKINIISSSMKNLTFSINDEFSISNNLSFLNNDTNFIKSSRNIGNKINVSIISDGLEEIFGDLKSYSGSDYCGQIDEVYIYNLGCI
jgi:hypothetical protein